MKYLVIESACQTCSFRNPEFQNFHKSFELPPPTTIIGMAGAALGLSPKKTQEFFDNKFEFGIAGRYNGKSNDLWKYRKLKGKKFISDILTKEVLFQANFIIVFGHNDEHKLNGLNDAFKSPAYALTLGNSDGLAKIIGTHLINKTINCEILENCIVEGNLMKEVLNNSENIEFSLKDGVDPLSYEIPVSFSYESDYGVRNVNARKEFSFIGPELYIRGLNKKGIQFKNQQIPLFKLYD